MKLRSKALAALLVLLACGGHSGSSESQRQQLLARVGDLGDVGRPRPLVPLEAFFEGNRDPDSIGYNLADPPAPAEFFAAFKAVRARPEVSAVLVQVNDLDDPAGWPSTDTIWVITSAPPDQLRGWLGERFAPDELVDGFPEDDSVEPYRVPPGQRALGVWWE